MFFWLGPLLASLVLSLSTALFAFRRRKVTLAARAFAAVPLSHALWTSLEIASLITPSLQWKLLFNGLEWLAGLGMIAATLWFAFEYSGQRFRIELWGWLLIAPLPLVLMLIGEPLHHRLHPEAWVRMHVNPTSLEYDWGWPEIGLIAYGCIVSLLACGLVLRRLAHQHPRYLTEVVIIVVGLALPPVVAVLTLALDIRTFHQRDPMPVVFGVADLIVAVGLFRQRVFELAPLALEAVVNGLEDGVVVCDLKGRIVDFNSAFTRMLRLRPASLIGFPADVALAAWPSLIAACRGGLTHQELALDASSGRTEGAAEIPNRAKRWLDVNASTVGDWRGQRMGRVVVLRDITAGKRASQRRFEAVFDHTFELIALLDPDGTVLEVNQTALAFGGVQRHAVHGRPLWEAPWWAHSPTLREELRAAIQGMTTGAVIRFEATHLRCDSRMRYVDFSLSALRNDAGELDYLIAEGRDVTELLSAEKQNAALAEKLGHLRRLEMIGRFAGGIAHDFNNLLVAIMGSTEIVKRTMTPGSPGAQALQVIEQSAASAARLTRQLLNVGRPQPIADRPIDVATVIGRSAALIVPAVGNAVTVMVDKPQDIWPVRIDPGQLEQVLLNLALNARDAMPAGGSLRIAASNQRLRESRRFMGMEIEPGDYVQLQVADTGNGMSDDVLERAFEPFFTTKSSGRGTGLGLAVVYGIVHGNGGHLEVSSTPDAGTEVRVYLPRADGAAERAPAGLPSPFAAPRPGGANGAAAAPAPAPVVIVEDELTLRSFLRYQLVAAGYTVCAYPDGARAETGAAQLNAPPMLLIADFVLPDETGLDVADSFRRRWPGLKVLLMSAYSPTTPERQGRGDLCFLTKPFDAPTLTMAVRDILAR